MGQARGCGSVVVTVTVTRERTADERPGSSLAHLGIGGGAMVTLCGYVPTRRITKTEARRLGICAVCGTMFFELHGRHADTRGRP